MWSICQPERQIYIFSFKGDIFAVLRQGRIVGDFGARINKVVGHVMPCIIFHFVTILNQHRITFLHFSFEFEWFDAVVGNYAVQPYPKWTEASSTAKFTLLLFNKCSKHCRQRDSIFLVLYVVLFFCKHNHSYVWKYEKWTPPARCHGCLQKNGRKILRLMIFFLPCIHMSCFLPHQTLLPSVTPGID